MVAVGWKLCVESVSVWKVCVCVCVCVCEVGLKGVLAIIVLLKVTVILDPAMAHPASVGPANVTKRRSISVNGSQAGRGGGGASSNMKGTPIRLILCGVYLPLVYPLAAYACEPWVKSHRGGGSGCVPWVCRGGRGRHDETVRPAPAKHTPKKQRAGTAGWAPQGGHRTGGPQRCKGSSALEGTAEDT